jgi:hypothetical protein
MDHLATETGADAADPAIIVASNDPTIEFKAASGIVSRH